MHPPPYPVVVFTLIAALAGIATATAGARTSTARPSVMGIVTATAPGMLMLALFYSLAVNMYWTLEDWPMSIGNRGFPDQLIAHADLAGSWFAILLFTSLFLWPVACGACVFVERWRQGLLYLGAFALSVVVCAVGILVAPARFANWWWD